MEERAGPLAMVYKWRMRRGKPVTKSHKGYGLTWRSIRGKEVE